MAKRSVSILLAAGVVLALVYVLIYFTGYSGGATGAFTAVPSTGHAIFALVIAMLALFGIWQSKGSKK